MPLIHNKDGDLAFTVAGEELVTWNDQPLTLRFVSSMMNFVYAQGVSDGGKVLGQIKNILREADL